jgi:hypothetical protein
MKIGALFIILQRYVFAIASLRGTSNAVASLNVII